MARERASAGPEISLFPFLSILACLIGALTILIVALSVSEILQGRKDESVARAEDYVALQTEIADREAEIARREEELRRTNATVVELAEIQPRIKEMQAELEDLRTDASKLPPLVRQMEEARKERDRIEDERKKVEAGLIEGRERLGELAKQAGKGLPLRILSTSNYFRRVTPVFVEARKEGVVIHRLPAVHPRSLQLDERKASFWPSGEKVGNACWRRDCRMTWCLPSDGKRAR